VSTILDKARKGGISGIPSETTSHGIRVAATDCMIFNPMLSIFSVIARGGWDFEADSTAFRYFTSKLHVVAGGLSLAGWSDPRMHVAAPSLDCITGGGASALVRRLSTTLFRGTDVPMLNVPDKLRPFRDVMTASILMYHADVVKALGSNPHRQETSSHRQFFAH